MFCIYYMINNKVGNIMNITPEEYQFYIKNGFFPQRDKKHPFITTEHDLQVWFCEELDKHNIFYFAVPNGELRAISVANRLKAEGVKRGVSDIIVVLKDNVVFIEMKNEKGKQSVWQKDFEKKVKELGYTYIVLHNQKECIEFIEAITSENELEVIIKEINNMCKMKKV